MMQPDPMRLLIALHDVVLGGDTINALEIGCRLADRGHDVTLFAVTRHRSSAAEAPLLRMAEDRRMRVQIFDEPTGVLGRARLVGQVASFVRSGGFDVVHSFGHRDTYYAFCGSYGLAGTPLVVNDYAMTVTRGLPLRVPLVVGTREVRDEAAQVRTGPTYVIEPPVDERDNRPDAVDAQSFRPDHGVGLDDVMAVVVSRFVRDLKGEGLHAAVEAVSLLEEGPVRLVMVGDGGARDDLQGHADRVNAELGYAAVRLPGALVDPRPAYQAADIVIGMGHSALRGMAFGKPVIVTGEHGFAAPITPETMGHFRYHGIYGLGDGGDAAPRLASHLAALVDDPGLRKELGEFGRQLIVDTYGLDAATSRLEDIYRDSLTRRSMRSWLSDASHVAASYGPSKVRRLARKSAFASPLQVRRAPSPL